MKCVNKKQKQLQQILMKKHAICKPKTFYILPVFSLITVALLIAVSIYCYLVKYQAKKNIYYHITSQMTNWKYRLK